MALSPAMLRERAAACLWGVFMGDALAMPVHWYYSLATLRQHFPKGIARYEAPPMHLEGSILNLSNTGGAGRSGSNKSAGDIVGKVILFGKREFWTRGKNYHYHCTLAKGENTLEAQLTRELMRTLTTVGAFDRDTWLQRFTTFLTTPGSHNDTYASSYIRQFFANREAGRPLAECADNDGHNTDAIDALTGLAPLVVLAQAQGRDPAPDVEAFLASTRRSTHLPAYGRLYARMLAELLARPADVSPATALRAAAERAAADLRFDLAAAVARHKTSDPMVACYIDSSFPALLVFVAKYAEADPRTVLLASANAGGENVARGAALGALLGAAHGSDAWREAWLYDDLVANQAVREEIEALLVAGGL